MKGGEIMQALIAIITSVIAKASPSGSVRSWSLDLQMARQQD